jgi:hypothetical protein
MSISKRGNTNILNLNSVYMDFETSEFKTNSGLIHHKPYYNHITRYKDG